MGGIPRSVIAAAADKCTSSGAAVVSATAPQAAVIGRDAFRDGGNAFDAALAAALAETVLLPPKCGLAGDLVALCLHPQGTPRALVAVGPAPASLGDAVARNGALPATGALAVGVPGAPAGYAALAGLGTLGLARAAWPAIELARRGFAWSPVSERYVRLSRDLLRRENPGGTTYLPDGEPAPAGSLIRLPGLAQVLEEFTRLGPALFAGTLGAALAGAVRRRGGVVTPDDLTRAEARWDDAGSVTVGSRQVWSTPSPTHGPSLLAALAAAGSGDDPAALCEAVQGAIAERERRAGDPLGDAGTSVVTAADAEGNAAVVVHSNSHPTFGSGIVVEPHGLVLANRAGRGFSARPGHPNFPRRDRRPVTTLHAWALGPAAGRPVLAGATPGGENQMPWNAQVIGKLIAGMAPAHAILEPRWGRRADGSLEAEDGTPPALAGASAVTGVPLWSLPSGMQVLDLERDGLPGTRTVSADIRLIGGTAATLAGLRPGYSSWLWARSQLARRCRRIRPASSPASCLASRSTSSWCSR